MKQTALAALLALTQSGCIAVGGYSSTGGWYFWPGGLGLLVTILLLYLVFQRRRR